MAIFMIERQFAEQLDPTAEIVEGVNRVNDEEGVRWLYSFLSADKRKTYCLYEAESPEAILRAARRSGMPADVVIELGARITTSGELVPVEG